MKQERPDNRSTIYMICLLLLLVGGIFFAALTGIRIENYQKPYLFVFIFSVPGVIFGYIVARKLKLFIKNHKKQLTEYSIHRIFWILVFIPYFSFAGTIVNINLSEVTHCNDYVVIEKIRKKRIRTTEINQLVVDIDGRSIGLYCSHDYLDKTSYGQAINICFYKSKINFDFIKITNDQKN